MSWHVLEAAGGWQYHDCIMAIIKKIKNESKDRRNNDVHGYPSLARSDHEGTAQGTIYVFDIRSLQLINNKYLTASI